MSDDKITIIMVVKNETKFIINVLRKMCRQKLDQLILVDGGSTDDHIGLYNNLQKKYDFEYVVNDVEPGSAYDTPFGAFLAGLPYVNHDYVSLWSVDDDPYPGYLNRMRLVIKHYRPPLIICSADVARENIIYKRVLYPFDCYVSPECMEKNYRTFSRRINLVGSVIEKRIVLENISYLTKVNFDSTYFFHTAFDKGFYNIAQPQILYRSYINSHGQVGKLEDIKRWEIVSKRRFKITPETYERALNAGFWDNLGRNHKMLNLVPHFPYFIRKSIYESIYNYDSKEEK